MILMKPEKIINMMTLAILYLSAFSYVIIFFSNNVFVKQIMSEEFSFIFPTIVFISFWYIQLKRKKENVSLPKFYLYVSLNTLVPYLICLIPYMVYESNNDFFSSFIFGNNMAQFKFIKIMIELFIIYPILEYWVLNRAKFMLIASFSLAIIFNVFNLSTYLMTEVFEYIIFATIGITFAEYERSANRFLRSNKKKIFNSFAEGIILISFANIFVNYKWLFPAVTTFYSIATMLKICYYCLKYKLFCFDFRSVGRGYIMDFFARNPLIIFISTWLLSPLIIKIIYNFVVSLNLSKQAISGVIFIFAALIFLISKKIADIHYINHKRELYLSKERW